ncbi:CRISPR-associated endonuclease Cas2 [Candidatus Uhrbacteria bacterium]|nr:CRISPR-associated endonuclease Cas2 [Candidatus Uhrbacteria bacterium]
MKNHSPQKKRTPSIAKQFLVALARCMHRGLVNFVDVNLALLSPRDRKILTHGDIDRVREFWAHDEQRYQKMLLEKLKERRWIEERRVGKRVYIALTEKGKHLVLKERMHTAPACMSNECIIVIFDVPERERRVRRQFRLFLKQCKFTQLQKSVWMHGCDVLDAMREFIRDTKSERWVRVFRAHNVSMQ